MTIIREADINPEIQMLVDELLLLAKKYQYVVGPGLAKEICHRAWVEIDRQAQKKEE